jgi:hypothetical protein
MGGFLTKITENFECSSSCSINHELHEEVDNVCFKDMNLNQKEIKLINKIIKNEIIKINSNIS